MGVSKKVERFEIHLRPNKPYEDELIEILDNLEGSHGAKSEFIRECLHLGLDAFKSKFENLSQQDDATAILDELANTLADNKFNYRVLKTIIDCAKPVNKVRAMEKPAVSQQEVRQEEVQKEQATANKNEVGKPFVDWSALRGLAGSGDDK